MARLIASTELRDRLQTQDVLLVDVGAPDSFDKAHVPGAVNIPLTTLREIAAEQRTAFLRRDYIIVYGDTPEEEPSQSDEAAEILEELGFERVGNFFGGRNAWFNAGYKLSEEN